MFILFFYIEDNGISTYVLFFNIQSQCVCGVVNCHIFPPEHNGLLLRKAEQDFNECARCSACVRTRVLGL